MLEATRLTEVLTTRWAVVGLDVDPSWPLVRRVARLVEAADALGRARHVVAARDRAAAALVDAGAAVAIPDMRRWAELGRALAAVRAQQEADAAAAHIAEQVAALELAWAKAAEPGPELSAAITALATRSADAYEAALASIGAARREQADQARCDQLWERLHDIHPGLAQLLERTAADTGWEARLATVEGAWA
jgi:hypothetical protein